MIEVVYVRYGGRYIAEFDDEYDDPMEAAFGYIELGENQGEFSTVGIFKDGEPVVWDGYRETVVPNDNQRQIMLDEYARAKEHR